MTNNHKVIKTRICYMMIDINGNPITQEKDEQVNTQKEEEITEKEDE